MLRRRSASVVAATPPLLLSSSALLAASDSPCTTTVTSTAHHHLPRSCIGADTEQLSHLRDQSNLQVHKKSMPLLGAVTLQDGYRYSKSKGLSASEREIGTETQQRLAHSRSASDDRNLELGEQAFAEQACVFHTGGDKNT